MARALPVAVFLSCLAGASAARGAEHEALELPWRKGLLVGSVLGRAVSRNAVVAHGEAQVGRVGELTMDPKGDAAGRLKETIADFLAGLDPPDEASLKMLLEDLRRRGNVAAELAAGLEASFQGEQTPWTQQGDANNMVDVIMLPYVEGSQVVQIGRFRVRDHRDPTYAKMLGNMLWGAQRSDAFDGLFLHALAQSHTEEELAEDPDAEVLMVFEPQISSLRDFVHEHQPDVRQSLELFIHAVRLVYKLVELEIPHDSGLILPQTFAVKGNLADSGSLRLVFLPFVLIKGQTHDGTALFFEDSRQLGILLRFLFDRMWPSEDKLKVDAIMAFGKAMESGAFPYGGVVESRELFDAILGETSPERLMSLRMEYLKLALVTQKKKASL